MNIIDLIFLAGIVLSAAWGLRQGLINSLGGIFVVYLSYYFAQSLTANFAAQNPFVLIGIFILLYAVGVLLVGLLKKIIEVKILGPFDAVGGFVFSAVKFMLIAAVLSQITMYFPLDDSLQKQLDSSFLMKVSSEIFKKTYPITKAAFPQVKTFVDNNVIPAIKDYKDEKNREKVQAVTEIKERFVETITRTVEAIQAEISEIEVPKIRKIDVSKIIQ